jgi:hypothetical protein
MVAELVNERRNAPARHNVDASARQGKTGLREIDDFGRAFERLPAVEGCVVIMFHYRLLKAGGAPVT